MGFKIDAGMFTKGTTAQILSRFTWELPQNLIGYFGNGFSSTFGGVRSVDYYRGVTVVESYSKKAFGMSGAGVTLGSFIHGQKGIEADPNNSLFQHEFGHYLQSRNFGWLYLPKFGIPSMNSAGGDGEHSYHPVEQDANARALKYFVGKYGEDFAKRSENKGWNNTENPIIDYNWSEKFSSESNQAAIKNAKMGLTGMDILGYPLSFAFYYAAPIYGFYTIKWYWASAATFGWIGAGSFGTGLFY